FHFALDDHGALLLGKSEMLITHGDLFAPVDIKWRLFRKVVRPALRDRIRVMAADPGNGASQSVGDNLREAAFNIVEAAQVVLDSSGVLVMANETARRTFGLGIGDIGRPIQDLELSYKPIELRGHLEQATRERRAVEVPAVRWNTGGHQRIFDVR